MKKIRNAKLSLNRETIRNLQAAQLAAVAGGQATRTADSHTFCTSIRCTMWTQGECDSSALNCPTPACPSA